MDEKQVVNLAQKGDAQAFKILYRKYLKMIYGYVFRKVGKREEAEDLTAEIWLAVVEDLPQFRGTSSFKNWLFGIAKHKILDYYQKKYKIKEIPLVEQAFLGKENDSDDKNDKERKVEAILNQLPNNYQQVLRLRFLKGATTAEIANKLGLSLTNVKVIQYRALKKAGKLNLANL